MQLILEPIDHTGSWREKYVSSVACWGPSDKAWRETFYSLCLAPGFNSLSSRNVPGVRSQAPTGGCARLAWPWPSRQTTLESPNS